MARVLCMPTIKLDDRLASFIDAEVGDGALRDVCSLVRSAQTSRSNWE